MGRTIRSRASGRIRHRLLRHAQGDGGARRGPQPHRAGVARSGGRQCGRLRHARWPRRGRLPRRNAGRRTQSGATRLRHRRRAGSRRHQCVRHGHRQVERPLRHPPQHAGKHRGILSGSRSRRPRRGAEPMHTAVERIRHRHPSAPARHGQRQRTADPRKSARPCA